MKIRIIILSLVLLLALSVGANAITMGDFPPGKWLDHNWNAVWEFTATNIRILDLDGGVYYDFDGKTINDLNVETKGEDIVLSFSCEETKKRYSFSKSVTDLTNLDITMIITIADIDPYRVRMKSQ